MNSEELRELRKKVKNQKKKNEELRELISEKKELEKDEKVKRYLELSSMHLNSYRVYSSEEEIISNIIWHKDFKDTNDILVYMGTFIYNHEIDIVHGSNDYPVKRNDERADYSLYVDLENSWNEIRVKIKNREKFEQSHNNIIYLDGVFSSTLEREYKKLKLEFVKDVLENGQRKAVSRLRKKCNNK